MSYWISNSKITLVTPSELFVLICFIPSTLLRLFSRGFAINLAPSSGDAPSKKTVTLIKGNWILGLEEIWISCLAYAPARMITNAIVRVVFAFDKAKSTILSIIRDQVICNDLSIFNKTLTLNYNFNRIW